MKIRTVGLIILTSISLIACSSKDIKETVANEVVKETETLIHIKLENSTEEPWETHEAKETVSEEIETSKEKEKYNVDTSYIYNQEVKQQYQNVKVQMDDYKYLGWTDTTSYFEPLIDGVLGKNGVMLAYHNLGNRYPNLINFNDITTDVIVTTVENTLEDGQIETQEVQMPITLDILIPDEVRKEMNLNLTDEDLTNCNMLWTEINGEKHLLVSKNINEHKSYGICITQNNGIIKMVAVMDNGVEALKLQDTAYKIMKKAEFNGEKSLVTSKMDNINIVEASKNVEFTQNINIEFGITKFDDIKDSLEGYDITEEITDGKLKKISIKTKYTLNPLILIVDGYDNIIGVEADYHTERNLLYIDIYPKVFSPYMTLNEIVEQLGDKYTENKLDSGTEYTWEINDCIYKCVIYRKTSGVYAVSQCNIIKNVDMGQLPDIVEEIEIESEE